MQYSKMETHSHQPATNKYKINQIKTWINPNHDLKLTEATITGLRYEIMIKQRES